MAGQDGDLPLGPGRGDLREMIGGDDGAGAEVGVEELAYEEDVPGVGQIVETPKSQKVKKSKRQGGIVSGRGWLGFWGREGALGRD